MVTRVVGSGKNLLLTLWLALPILVVMGLVVVIFAAHARGPAMDARAVGQGAGDTGGANALGEWLAGRDVLAEEEIRRDLREGRLVEVVDWPDGVRVVLRPSGPGEPRQGRAFVVLWTGRGSARQVERLPFEAADDGRLIATVTHARLSAAFSEGREGAGVYLDLGEGFEVRDGVPVTSEGAGCTRVDLGRVESNAVTPGTPITVVVDPSRGVVPGGATP